MPPPHSNKGLATVLSLSVATGVAWAGPVQTGSYQAEAYGQVEVTTVTVPEGTERVVATASGGPCDFAPGTEVFSGEMQGDRVLVGSLLLCQEGEGCQAQVRHPVLAIYTSTDGVLSALVRLQEGCTSKALARGSSLVVFRGPPVREPEGEDEGEDARAAPMPVVPVRAVTPDGAGSAQQVAKAIAETDVPGLMKDGQRLLASGNYSNALAKFGSVLVVDKRHVEAMVGVAASHLGMKQPDRAFEYLDNARSLASGRADLHLWLAYAWFQKGDLQRMRSALDSALDKGWEPGGRAESMAMKALEGELAAARERLRTRKRRDGAGAGNTRP